MPAPTDDEDVVVPLHLQPVVDRPAGWRGRSVTFLAVGLVGFLVTALVLGRAMDVGPSRPPVAAIGPTSPAATASRSLPPTPPPEPQADRLPQIEITGSRLPTERRLVFADGLQVLDLTNGTLGPITKPFNGQVPFNDQLLPLGADQVVCACVLGGFLEGDTVGSATLQFGRYDLDGSAILERPLIDFAGISVVPGFGPGVTVAGALSPDRTRLYALVAAREPAFWSVDLYEIRIATGKIAGHVSLGRLPVMPPPGAAPSASAADTGQVGAQPDGVYVWSNGLTVAPDGQTLFASIDYQDVRSAVWTNHDREWMVPATGGHPGKAVRIPTAAARKPDDWCISPPRFVDPDLLVQPCAAVTGQGVATAYYVRRLTADGHSLGELHVPAFLVNQQYPISAVVDGAARVVLLWDQVSHTIGRVAIDDGSVAMSSVPAAQRPPGAATAAGAGIGPNPGLVESPDGTRLYALGVLPGGNRGGRSSGVWVFDARTLQLLDHWAPRALLSSLAVSADGAFVYAAGALGFDVNGNEAAWPASVTVYDTSSGAIEVTYGAVSSDAWITFPNWP